MILKVIGSGSSGNCYLMDSGKEVLIIEAGMTIRKLKEALGFDLSRVVGCLVTHEHKDHSGHAKAYAKAGIDIYSSAGTLKDLGVDEHRAKPMELMEMTRIGAFDVAPFDVVHDAAEPVGFIIEHPDMGRAFFVTDTHFIRYRIGDLDHLIIEANFSKDILERRVEEGLLHPKLAARIKRSHMSLEFVLGFLWINSLDPRTTVLIHLSNDNSNENRFKESIKKIVTGDVYVAYAGLEVSLDKYPF